MAAHPKRTPELVEDVLRRIAEGETLSSICRDVGITPSAWALWLRADSELAQNYQHARDVGADVIADQALAIMEAEPEHVVTVDDTGKKSTSRIDAGYVQWQKARVETRLKLLAKWNPKRYGDSSTISVGNKEGETLKVESIDEARRIAIETAAALRKQAREPEGK